MIDPGVRRAASVVAALSMISYLIVYARAGRPEGGLRKIARVDLVGLVPLVWVGATAWLE